MEICFNLNHVFDDDVSLFIGSISSPLRKLNFFKIPIKKIRSNSKAIKFTRANLIVIEYNEIIVRRRPAMGMLQSMIEVPNDPRVLHKKKLIKDNIIKSFSMKLNQISKKINYSFSHFNLNIEIHYTKIKKIKFKNCKWLSLNKIENSGVPTVMKTVVKTIGAKPTKDVKINAILIGRFEKLNNPARAKSIIFNKVQPLLPLDLLSLSYKISPDK